MFQYPDISYIIIPGNKDKLDELAIKKWERSVKSEENSVRQKDLLHSKRTWGT